MDGAAVAARSHPQQQPNEQTVRHRSGWCCSFFFATDGITTTAAAATTTSFEGGRRLSIILRGATRASAARARRNDDASWWLLRRPRRRAPPRREADDLGLVVARLFFSSLFQCPGAAAVISDSHRCRMLLLATLPPPRYLRFIRRIDLVACVFGMFGGTNALGGAISFARCRRSRSSATFSSSGSATYGGNLSRVRLYPVFGYALGTKGLDDTGSRASASPAASAGAAAPGSHWFARPKRTPAGEGRGREGARRSAPCCSVQLGQRARLVPAASPPRLA